MARLLNIAIGSTCSIPGDVMGNLAQIGNFAAQAGKNSCDLLLTPEMSASGYGGYPEVLSLAEPAGQGPIYRALSSMAQANNLAILAGFVESERDKRFLSHYAVFPDGLYLIQRKHRVTPREHPLNSAVELYYDDTEGIGHVHEGDEQFSFFEIKGVKCGIIICADLGIQTRNRIFDQNRLDLLLLPTSAGGTRDDRVTDADLMTQEGLKRYYKLVEGACFPGEGILECIRHRRGMAAVNMCGYDGRDFYHGGQGSIISPFGDVVGLLAGIPNLDRQQPRMVFGPIDFDERFA